MSRGACDAHAMLQSISDAGMIGLKVEASKKAEGVVQCDKHEHESSNRHQFGILQGADDVRREDLPLVSARNI